MFTLEELETAYHEFWEFVKDDVCSSGWLLRIKESRWIKNYFWQNNDIEETETHWRPKSLNK